MNAQDQGEGMANSAGDRSPLGMKPIHELVLQSVVLLMSAWWTSNGPAAFSINADFSLHPLRAVTAHVLVVPVTVNGWHALFHFATGVLGLTLGWRYQSAVVFAILSGVLYLTVATLGLVDGSSVLGVMAVDTFGNWVHAVEGFVMLSAGLLAVVAVRRTAKPVVAAAG